METGGSGQDTGDSRDSRDFIDFSDLPDEKPRITGIKEKYQIGETMEALCTSWQSHPPANLTWFINEEKVGSLGLGEK